MGGVLLFKTHCKIFQYWWCRGRETYGVYCVLFTDRITVCEQNAPKPFKSLGCGCREVLARGFGGQCSAPATCILCLKPLPQANRSLSRSSMSDKNFVFLGMVAILLTLWVLISLLIYLLKKLQATRFGLLLPVHASPKTLENRSPRSCP